MTAVSSSLAVFRDRGKNHFLRRMERLLKPDAFADFKRNIDAELEVPLARDDARACRALVNGRELVVFGAMKRVRGEPILEARVGEESSVVGALSSGVVRLGFDIWASFGLVLSDGFLLPEPLRRLDTSNPVVDTLEGALLEAVAPRFGPSHSPWPHNAPFALCLSHDVDRIRKTFQHLTHPAREASRGHVVRAARLATRIDPGAYWCFDRVEALERRHRVKSTFFFLHEAPDSAAKSGWERLLLSGVARLDNPNVAAVAARLGEQGWEIGLHSSTYSRSNLPRLRREKSLLERIVGHPVAGVRQHLLSPLVSELWTAEQKSGFQYDSTAGFADRIGFRSGTCFPYPIQAMTELYEMPFQVMDGALSGRSDPWTDCRSVLEQVASVGGAMGLLWHQRFFNEDEFPGFSELYERLITESKHRGAWVAPFGEIVKWWRGDSDDV